MKVIVTVLLLGFGGIVWKNKYIDDQYEVGYLIVMALIIIGMMLFG